ncbi:helix-turn-helix domain-containing protein [Erysipelotrichaceae bacterium RD49]|nr:helix-turn-helix domain-containing protein [Erysipelotrichaceae bacterium RD49]
MKISETCKYLGVTRYTLYKMIEAGLLVHDYIYSYYLCDQEKLDKSLDKHVQAI